MNTRTRVLSSVVAASCAVTLASCASDDLGLQQWPDAPDPTLALPNGSQLADNVDDIDTPRGNENTPDAGRPFGSLRPDVDPETGEEVSPAQRVPEIIERGRLVVGVAQSLNRLGFRDPVTGELTGFEIDLAREIARDIFGDPDRIEYRYIEGNSIEDVLAAGTVDLAVRTFTVTRPRQDRVEFSVPYLTTYPRILTMRDSGITDEEDLADKTVCVTSDSTMLEELRDNVPHKDILATRTWSDCLMAVQRHQADAIYSDSAILTGLQAQDPYTEIVGDDTSGADYGVAAALPSQRDTAGLIRQVNATMERIRNDGTWQDLYSRWMEGFLGEAGPPAAEYRSEEQSRELAAERAAVADRTSGRTTTERKDGQ